MDDTKYLIRADVATAGVVERNDVVGAIYGQTEGLLGDELDLRDLQRTARVGRIDVEIESEEGRSTGRIEIETRLDKVETSLLAAALESIEQIGPCEASIEVDAIEDVRAARRREIVERAKELLDTAFQDDLGEGDLIEDVREHARAGHLTEYEGLPAGPRVASGDALVVVEGRSDVRTLLGHGVKNAIAVEGTDVPDAVAELTGERTTTAFLDGDRGGDLILRELGQVGDLDYVAFAPDGRSVEDLERHEAYAALREKVPVEVALAGADEEPAGGPAVADATPTDGGVPAGIDPDEQFEGTPSPVSPEGPSSSESGPGVETESENDPDSGEVTLRDHVDAVIGDGTDRARFLDGADPLEEVSREDVIDALEDVETVPSVIVLDGRCDQRLIDVAAQHGVGQIVARETGSFVKRPVDVRVRTPEEFDVRPGDA